MKRAKTVALPLLLLPLLSSCDPTTTQAVSVIQCASQDETLSVAMKNPAKAKAYLERLQTRLQEKDPKAPEDAARIVGALLKCVPE